MKLNELSSKTRPEMQRNLYLKFNLILVTQIRLFYGLYHDICIMNSVIGIVHLNKNI